MVAFEKPVSITYRNHRGETAKRVITPQRVWFGSTEWHPEPQWLLTAFDHEKQANRDFALKDFGHPTPSPRAQALEEVHSDLINRLNDDIAQLERAAEQAKFAGSETGVRVKSPSVLLADLRDAAVAIRALSHPVSPDMGVERPVEGGWLPIETAPNNKAILVHYDDGNIELISADDNEYSWIAYTVKEDFCTKPTHWRPLPQAPGVAV